MRNKGGEIENSTVWENNDEMERSYCEKHPKIKFSMFLKDSIKSSSYLNICMSDKFYIGIKADR
jgi:hypothetical protein